jgi:alpha-ketoglutarate-dependent taurine dioxygenase
MRSPQLQKPSIENLGGIKRKELAASPEEMIEAAPLPNGNSLPLLLQPAIDEVCLVAWAANNRAYLNAQLSKHGAILFRDFKLKSIDEFEQLIKAVSGESLAYHERSSPRHEVKGNIYTSTDYPAEQSIFLHNENSYQQIFPLKIFFYCVTPAEGGGETPLADCRRVFERIAPEITDRFIRKGWMYVRNFGHGFGLPWQTVFQTADKAAVEEHCRAAGVEVEWKDDQHLRTRAVRTAVAKHPRTGETVWFNHAAFFHVSTLEPMIREALLSEFEEEYLPSNSYYGDGSPIEHWVLDALREAYYKEMVSFSWEKGDVLMLDNMLIAHGRAPYSGPRKIVVGMAEPFNRDGFN